MRIMKVIMTYDYLTLGRTRGGGGSGCHPDKASVADVFSSYSFFPRAHFELSLVMVSCYDYKI